jgi:hypothetical protein
MSEGTNAVIDRRDCLRLFGAGAVAWVSSRAIACSSPENEETDATEQALEAGTSPTEAGGDADAGVVEAAADADTSDATDAHDAADAHDATAFVILYDTYAQALYFDGTYGPTTGTIRAVDMGAGADKTYDFWHGHNGVLHRFTLTAAHFADLRKKKRVNLMTTVVEDHQHALFVDPVDLQWRVPGAMPVSVPV